MLAGCWLVDGWVFFTAKLRVKKRRFFSSWLTARLVPPSLLSWSVVRWLVLVKRLTECWLTLGGWLGVFLLQNSDCKPDGFFLAVDWLHGWRLPSLLSWSVVGWLVLAKRLRECWLTVDWWVTGCFFTAKFRLKNWRVFFLAVDWLHGWRLPSLLSWSVVGWLVLAKRLTECWLAVGWWVARCFFTAKFSL